MRYENIIKQIVSPTTTIGLWDVSGLSHDELMENATFFSEKEKSEIHILKSDHRKKEKLAAKILIGQLLGKDTQIIYDVHGKPFIGNSNCHLSISHSHGHLAVIVNEANSTGIDIQKFTPKISSIRKKFMSEAELKSISGLPEELEMQHVIWGAKECMYKEFGKEGIIFSEQMRCEPFNYTIKGVLNASLETKNTLKNYKIAYKKSGDFMLVYIVDWVAV